MTTSKLLIISIVILVARGEETKSKRGLSDIGLIGHGFDFGGHLGALSLGHGLESHSLGGLSLISKHVTVTNKIAVPVPQPYPVTIEKAVPVPVPHAVPVPVDKPYLVQVPHPVPVPIEKPIAVPIEKLVPVPVPHAVPVPVAKPIGVPVPHPVPVPLFKPVGVPVPQPIVIHKPVFASAHSLGHGAPLHHW